MADIGDIRVAANWMDRDEIVALLEAAGMACYDHETTDELREALLASVEDGSVDESSVMEHHPDA